MKNKMPNLQRRNLLQLMGALPAAGVAPAWAASGDVSLLDQSGAAPVKLAVAKLAAALKAHLHRNGVDPGEVHERYGAEGYGPSIYITDPDGNTVELKGEATRGL